MDSVVPTSPSTRAPSDSASNATRKKNRPGRNARDNTAPGTFPVVFATGAGEPTTDRFFSPDPQPLHDLAGSFGKHFVDHTEVSWHIGCEDLSRAFILSLAQQAVHAHTNLGLPLGDFSSLASTDNFLPASLRAVVQQFGEFSVPALGSRFLFKDYRTTVSSLVFCASRIGSHKPHVDPCFPVTQLWLPMHPTDRRTRHIFAVRLHNYMKQYSVTIPVAELELRLFSERSGSFEVVKGLIGIDDASRQRFDFLFTAMPTPAIWVAAFTPPAAQNALAQLGLHWPAPATADLDFAFRANIHFPTLVETWLRKRPTVERYLSCGSGIENKSSALGSASQLSSVTASMGVTRIDVTVTLTAPEFSLLACFPLSSINEEKQGVCMTTALPVSSKATEFTQRDWRT